MTDEKQTQEQADEEMINQGFQELLDSYLATKHRKKVEIITKAFNFAKQAHKGVKRRSGEPYLYQSGRTVGGREKRGGNNAGGGGILL